MNLLLQLTQLCYCSSDSVSAEDEIPEPSDDDAPFVVKSDHEFLPESDVNDDDDYQPTRRARTARRDKGMLQCSAYLNNFLKLSYSRFMLHYFYLT